MAAMQFEPHRIIITRNADLSIRFLDVSVQLLIPSSSSPFTSAFPRALPDLSIDVLALIGSPEIATHGLASCVGQARIDDIQFATESLEVALVLSGGEVLLYRMIDRQGTVERELLDKQLVSLDHVPVAEGLRFKPYFMIKAEAPATAFSISDVGEHHIRFRLYCTTYIRKASPRSHMRTGRCLSSTCVGHG